MVPIIPFIPRIKNMLINSLSTKYFIKVDSKPIKKYEPIYINVLIEPNFFLNRSLSLKL